MKRPILYTSALLLSGIALLLSGCRNNTQAQAAPIVDGNAAMSDPASANLLPVTGAQQGNAPPSGGSYPAPATRVAGSQYAAVPQSSSESYPPPAAPAQSSLNYGAGNSQQNEAYRYNTQQPQYDQQAAAPAPISGQEYDQYSDLLDSSVPAATQPPPPLPADYEQPEAPGPDYLWTPGYWNYASAGYYYVPGSWVGAPYAGALWTPGWWGYGGSRYRWHHGYWGRHVGYYGGVNYGFGFIGFGYQGGYWNGDHFFYNRAVNRVSPRVVNNYTYERRVSVVNNTYINNSRTSYYGGPGGLNRGPAPQEFAARREERTPPMQAQIANRQAAEQNRQQFFNTNNGRPQMLVAARALPADRGVAAPPRTMPSQAFANGRPQAGFQPNGGLSPNANLQGRQQFEQTQRQGQEAQRLQQQQENLQQRQEQEIQRQQLNTLRQQQVQANIQQRQGNEVQRQQLDAQRGQQVQSNLQQRQGEQQQRQQLDVQRQGQVQSNLQQRQTEQQQRQQLDLQRQQGEQANTQRQQQMDLQRNQQQQQQRQVEQQQRQQLDVQRQAADTQRQQQVNSQQQAAQQQRQQVDAVRQQQQQANAQREQQAAQQRQQTDTQRAQQQQQNVQRQQGIMQQREQTVRPAPAAAPRMEAPRPAPAPQHVEAPRAAPAPHVEAPHAAPAPAPQQHGEHH